MKLLRHVDDLATAKGINAVGVAGGVGGPFAVALDFDDLRGWLRLSVFGGRFGPVVESGHFASALVGICLPLGSLSGAAMLLGDEAVLFRSIGAGFSDALPLRCVGLPIFTVLVRLDPRVFPLAHDGFGGNGFILVFFGLLLPLIGREGGRLEAVICFLEARGEILIVCLQFGQSLLCMVAVWLNGCIGRRGLNDGLRLGGLTEIWVGGEVVGTVGPSGNERGKQDGFHFSNLPNFNLGGKSHE